MNDVASAVPPIRTLAHSRTFVGSRGSQVDISLDEGLADLNTLGLPTILSAITLPGGQLDITGMEEGGCINDTYVCVIHFTHNVMRHRNVRTSAQMGQLAADSRGH